MKKQLLALSFGESIFFEADKKKYQSIYVTAKKIGGFSLIKTTQNEIQGVLVKKEISLNSLTEFWDKITKNEIIGMPVKIPININRASLQAKIYKQKEYKVSLRGDTVTLYKSENITPNIWLENLNPISKDQAKIMIDKFNYFVNSFVI